MYFIKGTFKGYWADFPNDPSVVSSLPITGTECVLSLPSVKIVVLLKLLQDGSVKCVPIY